MIKVERSVELNAPADEVWSLIGGFGSLPNWYPGSEKCQVSERGGEIYRLTVLPNGAELEEHETARDEAGRSYSYDISRNPLPVSDYSSTIRVIGNGDRCRVEWTGSCKAAGVPDEKAEKIVRSIYDTGLDGLKKRFG